MHPRHSQPRRSTDWIDALETRRLLAASVTAVRGDDGAIVITGTRRADQIGVVEHFPGVAIYDVLGNGALVSQFGGGTAIRITGLQGDDDLSVATGITLPVTILGNGGRDTLGGGGGPDLLDGGVGADAVTGRGGADTLFGRRGADSLDGGDANDSLDGGAGRDVLIGGAGDDVLAGGAAVDTLDGGDGDDALTGGGGRDVLTGGPGADAFSKKDRPTEVLDLASEDTH